MIHKINWKHISQSINQATEQPFIIQNTRAISGGSINSTYQLTGRNNTFFVKVNHATLIDMFISEYTGLNEIAKTNTIKVPQTICYGVTHHHAFLVLEMLPLTSHNKSSEQLLAQQLATLHKIKQPYFGWHQNNTIGSTLQKNNPSDNWLGFYLKYRLNFQLSLAQKNGSSKQLICSGESLCNSLHSLLNHHPHPSLLHGDLWGGNTRLTTQGQPVIYDPACYYGDRETDIAMTELFGGFSEHFYAEYQQCYPLDSGYNTRKQLYNLYHILNHVNLFGSGYQSQAQHMINSLLSELS